MATCGSITTGVAQATADAALTSPPRGVVLSLRRETPGGGGNTKHRASPPHRGQNGGKRPVTEDPAGDGGWHRGPPRSAPLPGLPGGEAAEPCAHPSSAGATPPGRQDRRPLAPRHCPQDPAIEVPGHRTPGAGPPSSAPCRVWTSAPGPPQSAPGHPVLTLPGVRYSLFGPE